MIGEQVQLDRRAASLLDRLADLGRQRVDQATLDAVGRNDELTPTWRSTG